MVVFPPEKVRREKVVGDVTGLTANLLRRGDTDEEVTNIELFFDLVYVFAVTQLSHSLLARATVTGALQAALLLAMVWLVWFTRPG